MEDRRLIQQIEDLIDYKDKYMDLLYAVQTVHIEETRHQTALRYIKERENQCNDPEKQEGV